ncbi:hypothetical protein [Sciscionella marina]|uniref:hypothetical protein n=1 Tax=Sciscionella marina TaxID=508770 RepID=UPI00036F3300|nr:hypothetical protein [Sciscionella marina]
MPDTKLKQARLRRNLKADAVVRMILEMSPRFGVTPTSETSMKTNLSRWENGRQQVSEKYRPIFREIYGRENEQLGLPPDPEEDDEIAELRERIQIASSVDAGMIEAIRQRIDSMRYTDRKLGGPGLHDDLHNLITQIEGLLNYSTDIGQHATLAGALTEASTLAGWFALSRNAVGQAWKHYERGKRAAYESGNTALLAHATAEQAVVLLDIGEPEKAARQLEHARALAAHQVSPLLGAWLAAAHGEGLAAIGNRAAALHAFEQAAELLPSDPVDPQLPFVFLGGTHLDRWRGNALVRIGDTAAIDALTDALDQLPDDFARARVGMLVDLAFAYAATGDHAASQYHARHARQLGRQLNSDRHLRRLSSLTLPS